MKFTTLSIAIAITACGGHKQASTTTTPPPPPPPDNGGTMVAPEQIDEIQHDFERKNEIISNCLAMAMDAQEVKRGTHGEVSFEVVVGTNGSATSVKVIKTNLTAKSVIDCATKHVQEIEFPHIPRRYETSYEYAMEAN